MESRKDLMPSLGSVVPISPGQTATDLPVATRQGKQCPVAREAIAERQKDIYKNHYLWGMCWKCKHAERHSESMHQVLK